MFLLFGDGVPTFIPLKFHRPTKNYEYVRTISKLLLHSLSTVRGYLPRAPAIGGDIDVICSRCFLT